MLGTFLFDVPLATNRRHNGLFYVLSTLSLIATVASNAGFF